MYSSIIRDIIGLTFYSANAQEENKMDNFYAETLRKLLLADGVSETNVNTFVTQWLDYSPLGIKGNLNKSSFDAIVKTNPNRLVSYLEAKNKEGFALNSLKYSAIVLLKNGNPSNVSYGIYYVS